MRNWADAAAITETKGWIGERFDAGAGLQYLNARYYDPELGLFLQPDWFEVTKPGVGTNRYAYSFNDPVNLRDPLGNEVIDDRFTKEEAKALEEDFEEARDVLDKQIKTVKEILENRGVAKNDAEKATLRRIESHLGSGVEILGNYLEDLQRVRGKINEPGKGVKVVHGGPNAAARKKSGVRASAPRGRRGKRMTIYDDYFKSDLDAGAVVHEMGHNSLNLTDHLPLSVPIGPAVSGNRQIRIGYGSIAAKIANDLGVSLTDRFACSMDGFERC